MNRLLAVPFLLLVFAVPARADSSTLTFDKPHSFSRADARVRVQQLLDYWSERFGVRTEWVGDKARIDGAVMGMPVHGWVLVADHRVEAAASDPGVFFRSRARNYISSKLSKYLHPTYQEP